MVRAGILRLMRQRLREEDRRTEEAQRAHLEAYVAALRKAPIAVHTPAANAQHYEVPGGFYRLVLGRRLKLSCALWPPGVQSLDAAEDGMLRLTCAHAGLLGLSPAEYSVCVL